MENKSYIDGDGNIVIQGIFGGSVTINPKNPKELKDLIVGLGDRLRELPFEIVQLMEEKQDAKVELPEGAKLSLTTYVNIQTSFGSKQLTLGLSITNLTKEHRYFGDPFFVSTPKYTITKGVEHDTFKILSQTDVVFPVRLEYGQQQSLFFPVTQENMSLYDELLNKDPNATIQAFSSTTLGELFESNVYPVQKIMDAFNFTSK